MSTFDTTTAAGDTQPADSTTALTAVEASYDDNASYLEDGSVQKARKFITACMILLRRRPTETGGREAHIRFSPEELRLQIQDARAFLAANDTSRAPSVTQVSFQNFRRY